MQKQDKPQGSNIPGQISFSQIVSGEVKLPQVIEAVLALGDRTGEVDTQVLFYCLNAIIHNRIETLPKMQLIAALKRQLHGNQFWATGALYYLYLALHAKGIDIDLAQEDFQKIQETLANEESQRCPVCVTTEGLGYLNGWGQEGVNLVQAKLAFEDAAKMDYTPAIANLACVMILNQQMNDAYDLLIKYHNQDCAINYNIALIHLINESTVEADKKHSWIVAIEDLDLLIGQGQISTVLLARKLEQKVEFTSVKEKANPSERKRLKSSDTLPSAVEPPPPTHVGKQPKMGLFQTSGRAPMGSRFWHDGTNFEKSYEQSQKKLASTEKKLARARAEYTKKSDKNKKLKARIRELELKLQGQQQDLQHQPEPLAPGNLKMSETTAFMHEMG